MKERFFTERERVIDQFFKEFFSWDTGNVGMWILTGVAVFLAGIAMCFPYQSWESPDILWFVGMFGMSAVTSYLAPYLHFQEEGKSQKIYNKLQYLPVGLKELQRYRLKKVFLFCLKVAAIFLLIQLFFTLVVYHTITLWNIGYVVIGGFLFPLCVGALTALFSK